MILLPEGSAEARRWSPSSPGPASQSLRAPACHWQALRAHTLKLYEQGYQFPAVGPWAHGPTSLGLRFLFYRLRALTGPTSQGCWEARRKCQADRATASLTARPRSSQGSGRSLTTSEHRPLSGAPHPTPSWGPPLGPLLVLVTGCHFACLPSYSGKRIQP